MNWNELLKSAITKPGMMLRAYNYFHNYSLGNQLAALVQCDIQEIEPGPINTYPGWQSLNRQVKRGAKALSLCMPLKAKRQDEAGEDVHFIKNFVWKPRWFTLSQTEGEAIEAPKIIGWDKDLA